MAEVIRMPRLSDTMTEGVIVAWNKKVGDKVKPGDVLAEVETDKATMELESYQEGTLLYIGVEKGKAAKVDGVLAVIGKEGEAFEALLEPTAKTKGTHEVVHNAEEKIVVIDDDEHVPAGGTVATQKVSLPAGAKEIRMPLLSDTMTEGKIVAWHKQIGDFVKADDVLAEVETDKATMEVVGYEEGTLLYTGVEAGKAAKVNEIIAIVGKKGTDVSEYVAAEKNGTNANAQAATTNTATAAATAEQAPANVAPDGRIKASPLAKKLAAEKGFDISKISGTGDGGRITKKDIDSYSPTAAAPQVAPAQVTEAPKAVETTPAPTQAVASVPQVAEFKNSGVEGYTDIEVSQMRKVIARRLGESMYTAPHFYLTMEINMDNAMEARKAINEVSPVKISFNDMVIKACATALRSHPQVNSSWLGDTIRQNHHIHIGSAIALPEGLIVPVIKFADQKTLSQIANDANMLYQKARDKKIQPAEFSGNTFTISNLGMMGIEEFTAIINPPDSCILAVGAIKEIVVKKADGFGTTNVMKVTLSCDHRSVDGAVGAAFLQTLKKLIENPVTMLV